MFWNSWMELNGVLATSPLTVGEDYTFSVDLARYAYAVSTTAGDLINTEVRNAVERKEKTIALYVRPYVVGSALVWSEKVRAGYALTVSVESLKKPAAAQFADDVSTWNAYLDGKKTIGEISKQFSAANLRLPVIASKAGCGQVALSIWDGTGLRPLDHVVYSVPVGKRDACGPAGDAVNAGFSTVLEAAPSQAKPPSRPDAGLLIFDLPRSIGEVRGVGLLVDATPVADDKPHAVYAWPLFESVATYVTDPGNLLTLINSGRKKKTYAVAATELRTVVFPPGKNDDGTDGPGEVAFQALQRIARNADHDPVVVARVTASDRHAVYAPLSLLSTSGGPLAGRPIRVVHPAPFPPSSRQQACVGAWTFVVPASLANYQGDVVAEPDSSWISTSRQSTVDNLKGYFGKQLSTAQPGAAEGLLLLAHQSDGNIWFDKEDERLRIGDLTRRFAPGSVAVLSACSVAAADGDNEAWLGRLSGQGVSGIFASPFPVDLDYGVELTRSFIRAVRQAQAQPKNVEAPTIASLFVAASEAAAKQLKISPLDVQREFVWIGDPDIRLCK